MDDSPAIRAFGRRIVKLSGFDLSECHEAPHSGEALNIVGKQWMDVILADINMPVMDGEEFLLLLTADDVGMTLDTSCAGNEK